MSSRDTNSVSRCVLLFLFAFASACSDSTAPPKATGLSFIATPSATAVAMVPLAIQPAVQTVDANGRATAALTTITATVIGGPGQIEAGGTATTNESGLATFSNLTLGGITGEVGPLTLQFSAPGLQPLTTTVQLGCGRLPLSLPATVSRSLTTGDCIFGPGQYVNVFDLPTTAAATAVQVTLDATFPGGLYLQGPNETGTAYWGYQTESGATNKVTYKVLVPPGRTFFAILTDQSDVVGPYTFTTAVASEDLGCDSNATVVASPIKSSQKLDAFDCLENWYLEDFLVAGLPSHAILTVSMTSSAFDPTIKLLDGSRNVKATSTGQGSTSLTYTNTGSDQPYFLVFTSAAELGYGAYNFTMNIAYPSASAVRANLTLPLAVKPNALKSPAHF